MLTLVFWERVNIGKQSLFPYVPVLVPCSRKDPPPLHFLLFYYDSVHYEFVVMEKNQSKPPDPKISGKSKKADWRVKWQLWTKILDENFRIFFWQNPWAHCWAIRSCRISRCSSLSHVLLGYEDRKGVYQKSGQKWHKCFLERVFWHVKWRYWRDFSGMIRKKIGFFPIDVIKRLLRGTFF